LLSAKLSDFVRNFDTAMLVLISNIRFCNNFLFSADLQFVHKRNERSHRHDSAIQCSVTTPLCESTQQ